MVTRNPAAGPAGGRTGWGERLIALRDVWATLGLFVFVIGGIYIGAFTPTEAAGMGAAGSILIAWWRGALNMQVLLEVTRETTMTTAKLFLVLFGALIFSNFVNRAGLPDGLISIVNSFDASPLGVIFIILLIYLALGCVFESLSMILLTVPIFAPVVEALGFDLIWFGILVVVATEISLITPPIGLNGLRSERSVEGRACDYDFQRCHTVLGCRYIQARTARAGAISGTATAVLHVKAARQAAAIRTIQALLS